MDFFERLTGAPSKAAALDVDLDASDERERLKEARERVDTLTERLGELTDALDWHREQAEHTAVLNGEADEASDRIDEIEAKIRAVETEKGEAEVELRDARRALHAAQGEQVEAVRDEARAIRDEAMRRMDEALNAAMAAALELYVLRKIQAELPYSLEIKIPTHGELLPYKFGGKGSVLSDVRSERFGGWHGIDDYDSALDATPDADALRQWIQEHIVAARSVEAEDVGDEPEGVPA
jgi:hypothetical protein